MIVSFSRLYSILCAHFCIGKDISTRKQSIAEDPPPSVPLSQKMVPTPTTPSSVKSRSKQARVKPEPSLVKVLH